MMLIVSRSLPFLYSFQNSELRHFYWPEIEAIKLTNESTHSIV